MHLPTLCDRLLLRVASGQRPRRRLALSVRSLEGRQLLSSAPSVGLNPSATMTQTATFPNLESLPNRATQAFLYFSSTMGTLTEVDVITSGSYSTEFYAENLGPSSTTIAGTTSGNLAINVPTGAIPVTVPSVTETFNASPFDGDLDYAGTSGKDFAPVVSSSAAQTLVLKSPAELAAFTGNFRIPISVSGHATGSASSGNGDLSDGFNTQTSATITVVYHYVPNLPSLEPPPTNTNLQSPSVPSSANDSGSPAAPTGSAAGAVSLVTTPSIESVHSSTHAKKKVAKHAATSTHHFAHAVISHVRPRPYGNSRVVKAS
jgi:hypothetical protein